MSAILDALGYAGSLLEKPGRAVRGLLAGRPREALAALPFSDTLGATDPAERTTGHDLLRHLGVDVGDDLGGQAAGLGVDIGTDPLTYAGGYLLRGLLGRGGRAAGEAGADAHVYDLVDPAERALDTRNAEMIDRAFPIPHGPSPEELGYTPRHVVKAELDPYTEAGADAAMPGGELLRELPDPNTYGHLTGLQDSSYNPETYGIAADRAMGGDARGAFDTSLHNWDQVLGDLERLHPKARLKLMGGDNPAYRPSTPTMGAATEWDTPIPHYLPPTERGRGWQTAIKGRAGDLEAVQRLGDAAPWAEIGGGVNRQYRRLGHVLSGESAPMSSAHIMADDILQGRLRPSDVPGEAAKYLSHLPLDPAVLRRLAAEAQQSEAIGGVTGRLGNIVPDDMTFADLLARPTHPQPGYLIQDLRSALDPAHLVDQGIERGIAHQVTTRPHTLVGREPEYATQIVDARQLLERLLAEERARRLLG